MNYILGLLGPAAMLAACVFEALARRMARDPRHDKARREQHQKYADIGLVAAWLLLGGAYLFSGGGDARFESWMTIMLLALLVLDVIYLYLRRGRPRQDGKKKHFWEI